jgi:hypothetical protein
MSGIRSVRLSSITPSPENEKLYRPIREDDPAIIALAEDIGQNGLREPICITLDRYIVSGHRRHAAAKRAGLKTVCVRTLNLRRDTCDPNKYMALLRQHNLQRDKSREEKLREELVSVNPNEAYYALIAHRSARSYLSPVAGELQLYADVQERSRISDAKQPMLDRIIEILDELADFLPLSLRTLHYNLLNDPPLRHASKLDSRYRNDRKSYQDLSDLCTRARLAGLISFNAIADDTRPVTIWKVYDDPRHFIRSELNDFMKRYWRNLMVSQPNHLEIVCEKNTVEPMLRSVAAQYTIPITSGRGFASIPPRYEMAQRFKRSGKDSLVLIVMSDFDPSGESIAHSFAQSMRDDFGIKDIVAVKAGLTYEQVQEMELHTDFEAKRSDSRYKAFVEKYGSDVYELEAVNPPNRLQRMLRKTIDSVIDTEAFNAELDMEKEDATFIEGVRRRTFSVIAGLVQESDG